MKEALWELQWARDFCGSGDLRGSHHGQEMADIAWIATGLANSDILDEKRSSNLSR